MCCSHAGQPEREGDISLGVGLGCERLAVGKDLVLDGILRQEGDNKERGGASTPEIELEEAERRVARLRKAMKHVCKELTEGVVGRDDGKKVDVVALLIAELLHELIDTQVARHILETSSGKWPVQSRMTHRKALE